MAASPSPAAIRARKARRLAKVAKNYGGEVIDGEAVLPDGVKVGFRRLRASNGECALMPYADCGAYIAEGFEPLDALIDRAKAAYAKANPGVAA